MRPKILEPILAKAVAALPSKNIEVFWLNILANDASVGSPKAIPEIVALVDALRADSQLSMFDGTVMHVFPNSGFSLEYWHLAGRLLSRAIQAGPKQASIDLRRYLDAADLPCETLVAVSGIVPKKKSNLGQGISFVSWADLGEPPQENALIYGRYVPIRPQTPDAEVVRIQTFKKRLVPQKDASPDVLDIAVPIEYEALTDAVICLGLVGPYAPQIVASWIKLPTWVPMVGKSTTTYMNEGFALTRQLSRSECWRAAKLLRQLLAKSFDPSLRRIVRLSSERLTRAMRSLKPGNAAIDLCIALEMLYLHFIKDKETQGEMGFRLKLLAARYLRKNIDARSEISTLIEQVYKIRSTTVHGGELRDKRNSKPVLEILQEGYSITAETIRRYISSRGPDIGKILFS